MTLAEKSVGRSCSVFTVQRSTPQEVDFAYKLAPGADEVLSIHTATPPWCEQVPE